MNRVVFRERLILASSLVSVAPSHGLVSTAQAADPIIPVVIEAPVCNVPQSWVGAFGATGFENGGGGAEFFLPFMADCDRALFGFGRGVGLVDGIVGGDAGIGYRFLSKPDTGFGANVSGGYWESDEGTDAWRGTIGVEGEIGFRPITAGGPNLSQLDLRIYGTGFYYWADNSDNISTA